MRKIVLLLTLILLCNLSISAARAGRAIGKTYGYPMATYSDFGYVNVPIPGTGQYHTYEIGKCMMPVDNIIDLTNEPLHVGDTLTMNFFLKHGDEFIKYWNNRDYSKNMGAEFWSQSTNKNGEYNWAVLRGETGYSTTITTNGIEIFNEKHWIITQEMADIFNENGTYIVVHFYSSKDTHSFSTSLGEGMYKIKILSQETTPIEQVKINKPYTISNNTIYFENMVNNFSLYNIQGNVIYQSKMVNEVNLPDNLNKGVYIVKADNQIFKIIF